MWVKTLPDPFSEGQFSRFNVALSRYLEFES